jgi:hypothetical protein
MKNAFITAGQPDIVTYLAGLENAGAKKDIQRSLRISISDEEPIKDIIRDLHCDPYEFNDEEILQPVKPFKRLKVTGTSASDDLEAVIAEHASGVTDTSEVAQKQDVCNFVKELVTEIVHTSVTKSLDSVSDIDSVLREVCEEQGLDVEMFRNLNKDTTENENVKGDLEDEVEPMGEIVLINCLDCHLSLPVL